MNVCLVNRNSFLNRHFSLDKRSASEYSVRGWKGEQNDNLNQRQQNGWHGPAASSFSRSSVQSSGNQRKAVYDGGVR